MIPLTPNTAVVLCCLHTTLPLHVLVPSLGLSAIPDPVHWEWGAVCGEGEEGSEGRGERELGEGEETYSRQNELKRAQLYSLLIVASGLPVPLQW